MKLNPPASSSDLDVARQIARRLHQRSRRDDPTAETWPSDEAPARPRLTPPPLPPRSAQAESPEPEPFQPPERRAETTPRPPASSEDRAEVPAPPRPTPASPPVVARAPEPPPAFAPEPPEQPFEPRQSAHSFDVPEAPPFERPSWGEPPVDDPEDSPFEPGDPGPTPLEDLADPAEPGPYATEEPPPDEPAIDEPAMPDVDVDDPALSPEEPALSPEEMVGESAEVDVAQDDSSPLDQLTEPDASPFGDELLDAPPVAEEPAPPSWDEIVENCRGMGHAGGAMLIDPAGQVFATRGDWPAPGPNAIAGKLVAMMAKTLKDAPTRSISAPLMGMHLTAWRVPLSEGLVTVAFIGAAPVRSEARPLIDAEILSGVGS